MKRLISVLLTVIMVGTALCIPDLAADDEYWKREDNLSIDQAIWKTDSYKLGDVNGDGTVNALDAFTIVSYVTKFTSELNMSAADIDADGKVTAKDNFYFKASAAGICSIDDFENGQRVYKFTIAGNDISEYSLVLPADANYNDNIYFAYELLLKYIQKMTGVTLPKVYGDYDGKAIRLHSVAMDSELGEKLGDDGYEYIVKDGNLEIYGATRGNMYAAYDIIEKYLGVFFCNVSYSHSEKLRCSDIPEGTDFYFNTPTVCRFCMHTFGNESTTEFYALARHQNNLNRVLNPESYYGYYVGAQMLNAHSFWYYKCMGEGIMPEEGTINPDGTVMSLADRYYQKFLNGGGASAADSSSTQPCASDDSVFETLYSGMLDVVEMLRARGKTLNFAKDCHMLSFSINDNPDYCKCSLCNAKANGTTVRLRGSQKDHLANYVGYYKLSEDEKSVTFKKESYSGTYLAMIIRAADRIKEIYPDVQIFSILYDGTVPESVRPRENMVLCYCDNISGCSKCRLSDSDKCSPINSDTHSTKRDAEAISNWGKICRETGAQLYSWYYPENYTYYIVDLPKFFDIYYDIKWMCEQGVVGFYYEGVQSSGPEYTLCDMNAFLASEVMWNPSMTFDEYVALMKKYLRVKYGAGYEHIYNYICYLDEASEQDDTVCGAYFYRPFDAYSESYLNAHYEEMRAEIVAAMDECDSPNCTGCLNNLLMNCEMLGLSAAYDRLYTNGDGASRALYEERYTWLYNYIKSNSIMLTGPENAGAMHLPGTISFDKTPMVQIYLNGHRWGTK